MKKLNFVSVICIIFSLFTFTTAWSQFDLGSNGRGSNGVGSNGIFLPEAATTDNGSTDDNSPANPLGDRLSSFIDVSSTLKGLSATKFANSALIELAKNAIDTYCKENNIAVEKVISVIENFDNELQANAHGAQSRAIAPPTILISSDSDADDFARLMTQITGELVQEDKRREAIDIENEKKGIETETTKIFYGNEILSSNMVMPTYTLPIGKIAYKYPEVKGTNLLLGALDFQLNANLEKIGGVDGYNIGDVDTGLLMALSKHVDRRSDWGHIAGSRESLGNYQKAIEGLNNYYSGYIVPLAIGSAAEMKDFAELIDVAVKAYNNPRNGLGSPTPSVELWNRTLGVLRNQSYGPIEYRTIINYIKDNYKL